jgi:hypothetical protein
VARPALAGAAAFVASCLLPWVGLLDSAQIGDTHLYKTYGEAILDGELPYRDLYVEYPPGALPTFVVPAFAGDHYATVFKLLMVALGLATITLVVAALHRVDAPTGDLYRAALVIGFAPALLGPVFLVNYDLWPTMLTAAALALLVGRRELLGFAALGIATAAKVYPVVLVPLALVYVVRRSGRRAARNAGLAFCAALGAIVLPFVVLAAGGVGFDLLVALRRPLQIESLGSSILLALHSLGFYDPSVNSDYNSQNLGGALPRGVSVVTSLFELGALVLVWLTFARRRARPRTFFLASAAAVTAALCFAKVLSPQFLVWLVPLIALAVRPAGTAGIALVAAALALTHAWFPARYGELVALGDVAWLVLLRNLALVALFAWLFLRLRGEPTQA